ncbi:MAG: PilZ domain-containing protein [Myxococcales bacterium]|nr:PilZ domain-containing protein [Myxococcales bacterium]
MSRKAVADFLEYLGQRRVPESYHAVYTREIAAILAEEGLSSLSQLDGVALQAALRRVELLLQNRRAVVAALEAYLEDRRKGWTASKPPPPLNDELEVADFGGFKTDAGGAEHRRFVRVPFNGEVAVSGAVSGRNRASDISLGGLYLEALQAWERGEVLGLEFRLHRDERPVKVRGRVVYVDPGVGAGIDFIDPPSDVVAAIKRFVDEQLARERAGGSFFG